MHQTDSPMRRYFLYLGSYRSHCNDWWPLDFLSALGSLEARKYWKWES